MRSKRGEHIKRTLDYLQMLTRPKGWTIEALASELGVDPRTVRRDLAAFREADVPLQRTESPGTPDVLRIDPKALLDWLDVAPKKTRTPRK